MTDLEPGVTADQIRDAWGVSRSELDRLVAHGKVGFIRAGRSRRFLPEHLAQLRALVEVTPKPVSNLAQFGTTEAGIARRRTSA
jgi:hypothetical protein